MSSAEMTPRWQLTPIDRKRRAADVLDLLDRSYQAFYQGNTETSMSLAEEAADLDVHIVAAVQGGIMIGEIPNPKHDYAAWSDYVSSARNGLRIMIEEENR